MSENLPVHSPLGASSAERWMSCPGSVALIKHLELPPSDEEDWRREGVAAHEAAAKCLQEGLDGWELIGETFHDTPVDVEIAGAIQVYLDHVRSYMANEGSAPLVEARVSHPDHKLFYGTVDFAVVDGTVLHVRDYKHGQGIVVETDGNPQIMYYAFGLLQRYPDIQSVTLGIVQPRAFHVDGPIRVWETTAEYIKDWAAEELIPAMLRTEMDADLNPGPWCRFCPAKLVCPSMTALFGAAMTADPKRVVQLSNEGLGQTYQYVQGVKFYLKALEDEVFRRLNSGKAIAGVKLVHKRANRVWKPGALEFFQERFGPEAMTAPELKSPAEMEKISPSAKGFVKERAYTPESGLTVALESDQRGAVVIRPLSETFSDAIKNLDVNSEAA